MRVYEKDTDRVFIQAIRSDPQMVEAVCAALQIAPSPMSKVSPQSRHVGSSGTIDIDLTLEDGTRLLIENKIDAGYSITRLGEGQVDRYRKTVTALRAQGVDAKSVLLAPDSYLQSTRAGGGFDLVVSYEALCPVLSEPARETILEAIEQAQTPYEPEPNTASGAFFADYRVFVAARFSALVLKPDPNANGVRPPGSHTIYFNTSATLRAWPDIPTVSMSLQCRDKAAPSASVKILVRTWGRHAGQLRTPESLSDAGGYLRPAGQSLGIVIDTPQLDTQKPFQDQLAEVTEGLEAALRLQDWWRDAGDTLGTWKATVKALQAA